MPDPGYRGRFAPSPTGPLHFGSLITALGSYLDAKHHNGTWLVRMEDLDSPRTIPGAADTILHSLESIGLHWDETVIYQSRRIADYDAALHKLNSIGMAYLCCCTRKEIADSTLHGIEGHIYPGTCRNGLPALARGVLGECVQTTCSLHSMTHYRGTSVSAWNVISEISLSNVQMACSLINSQLSWMMLFRKLLK